MTGPDPTTQPKPGERVLIEAEVVEFAGRYSFSLLFPNGMRSSHNFAFHAFRWRPDVPDRDGHAAELAEAREQIQQLELNATGERVAHRITARERDGARNLLRLTQGEVARLNEESVAIARERDGLAEQLAAAQTEAERLREEVAAMEATGDGVLKAWRKTRAERDFARRIADWHTEKLIALRAEVQRIADDTAWVLNHDPTPGRGRAMLHRANRELRDALDASAATTPPQTPQPPQVDEQERRAMADEHRDDIEPDSGVAIEPKVLGQVMSVRFPSDLAAALRDRATLRSQTVSDFVRDTMAAALRTPHDDESTRLRRERDHAALAFTTLTDVTRAYVQTVETILKAAQETAPAATPADDPAPVVAEDVHDTPAQGHAGRALDEDDLSALTTALRYLTTCHCEPAWTERQMHSPQCLAEYREEVDLLAEELRVATSNTAELSGQVHDLRVERDAAHAAGRADAAKALRHAAEQLGPGKHDRGIDWAAEVAEQGEVPA